MNTRIASVFRRQGRHYRVDTGKLLDRLGPRGEISRFPADLPGTRLRLLATTSGLAFSELLKASSFGARKASLSELGRALARTPDHWRTAIGTVPADRPVVYPRYLATRLSQLVAIGLHTAALAAVPNRPRRGPALAPSAPALREEQRSYRILLGRLQLAAAAGNLAALSGVLDGVLARAKGPLLALCPRSATRASSDAAAVVVASLVRRYAMLAAAVVMLDWHIRQRGATCAAVQSAARTRHVLARPLPSPSGWRQSLGGARLRDRLSLVGRVTKSEFVERSKKPFSHVVLENRNTEVVVPYKSLGRIGCRPGSSLWVFGKVVRQDKTRALEVAFEGPGTHSRTSWEDWLAVLVRHGYNLYPDTLQAEWSLGPLGSSRASLDLLARLR